MFYRVLLCGLLALTLAACGGAPTTPEALPATATAEPSATSEPTSVPPTVAPTLAPTEDPEAALPAWADLTLVEATTGEPFMLADYAGQTVYVHLMATWCTNCLANQRRLRDEIIPQIGDANVVFISLDVQTQLANDTLANYATNNAFDWSFAVTSQEFMNAIVADYGRSASNPPSRPHFVIYPDGTTSGLLTGSKTTEEELNTILNTQGVGG